MLEESSNNTFNLMFTKFNLPKDELYKMSRQACSEGNFCVKLLNRIYNKEELQGKNCNGKRGQRPLDQYKLELIKETVFKIYSVSYLLRSDIWKKCVISIDEYLRRKSNVVHVK